MSSLFGNFLQIQDEFMSEPYWTDWERTRGKMEQARYLAYIAHREEKSDHWLVRNSYVRGKTFLEYLKFTGQHLETAFLAFMESAHLSSQNSRPGSPIITKEDHLDR